MKKNSTQHIHVENIKQAWEQADKIFPTDYMKDDRTSKIAGYDVYRSTAMSFPEGNDYISDLGNRLELNLCGENWESKTINIWIDFVERTSKGFRILCQE